MEGTIAPSMAAESNLAGNFRTLTAALDAAPGDRPFVTFWVDEDEHETVTFGGFRRRARSQAAMFLDHGIMAGDCIVIIMPQGIPAMTAFAGAMMLGAVPAFLAYPNFKVDPAKYRSGLAGVTANLKAKLVVIDNEFPDDLLEHVSVSGNSKLVRASSARPAADPVLPEVPADALAFIQHSAGTTGLQKGVALSHAAVLRQLGHLTDSLRIDPRSDCLYTWLPLYHDMGLIACFMLPLVCHLHVVMQSPLDWVMHPESMLQVISDYRCTLAWLPNFAFQFVPRRSPPDRWAHCDLSSLRALINCSEPVRAGSMDEFRRTFARVGLKPNALQSSYAMAENVFAVTQSDIGCGPKQIWADGLRFRSEHRVVPIAEARPGAVSFASSGRLLPNHEVRILSDCGMPCADGYVGEILIRSDSLFDGYYNRPDLTADAIIDGWYRTGDLGFLLEQELYVIGRKKDLIIVGGENLYPQDIEEIVSAHPAIRDGRVVAMGVYNPDLGTEEIVVVAEVETEELLSDRERIARELRNQAVAGLGVSVRTILLKPPRWIVKSTAGKPARAATRDKLFREHPQLANEPQEVE